MNVRTLAVALLLAGSPAGADSSVPRPRPVAPSAGDRETARKLFMEGVKRYEAGAFAEAAEKFERAWKLTDTPEVLFNVGQARRMNGEREAALEAYHAYLRRVPDTPNRKAVEQLIADLEQRADGGTR